MYSAYALALLVPILLFGVLELMQSSRSLRSLFNLKTSSSLSLSGHFNWPTTDIQFAYRLYLRLIVRIQQSTSSHYVPKDINIIITFVVVVVCLWYLIPSKSPTINIPSICHIMFQHKLFLWLCPVLCRWPARWNILHRALLLSRQSMYFLVNCTGTAS